MNKSVNKILLLIILVLLLVYSCKKDSVLPPVDMHYDYFPVNVGQWIIYDVDSVYCYYDDVKEKVIYHTFNYQIKEYIESTIMDNSNRPTQRIERYYRNDDTLEWQIKDVWYSNVTTTTAEKIEENVRFIKLVFPVKEWKEWDGNVYNIFDSRYYEYTDTHVPYTINSIVFDSTLTVLQIDEYNIIERKYAIEIYAKNAGMIYKKVIDTETKANGDTIKGVDYSYTIHSYGN